MTVRRTNGSFSGIPSGFATGNTLNAIDDLTDSPSTFSGWTVGSSIQAQVNLLGPLSTSAEIIAYSINAQMALVQMGNSGDPMFGKFGKLLAAVQFGVAQQDGFFSSTALPTDASLTSTVWDPAVDPLPPLRTSNTPADPALLLPVGLVYPLPQPLPIIEQSVAIGLWLTPSLLALQHSGLVVQAGLAILNAQYTVVYDDGR